MGPGRTARGRSRTPRGFFAATESREPWNPWSAKRGAVWHRGDVAQVKLEIDADADMTWVVVEDPLPPGAVVLGSGLGGDSSMLASGLRAATRGPCSTERGFDSYRAYYRYVPKGRFTLRYNVRYNSAGTFALPPTRVEAMYAPEMHGERPHQAGDDQVNPNCRHTEVDWMPGPLSRARLLSCGAASLFAALAGAEARIESFSPAGYTKDVSQVAVRFSEPMVTLGDPDRSDPFAVRCAVPGTGRWIDERNWVYDFAHEVPGAERCWFTLRRGVTTLARGNASPSHASTGSTPGARPFSTTWRISSWPQEIDERQVVLLALDAIADEDSIRAHAHCRVKGESRTIAVDVVSGRRAARSWRRWRRITPAISTNWSSRQPTTWWPRTIHRPSGRGRLSESPWCGAPNRCRVCRGRTRLGRRRCRYKRRGQPT